MRVGAATTGQDGVGLNVRLLGGVDVLTHQGRIALGGAKPRAILALLALQPGTAISAEHMVDAVWGDQPPPSVRASIQVHVSNLRRALSAAGVEPLVETRGSGYAFVADPSLVDVHRFEVDSRRARVAFSAGDFAAACVRARSARATWNGVPLAGLGGVPFVGARVTALEDEYLALIDLYADIEMALGRPADVVSDLEWSVNEHPYREPTWARLAVALYRSGRQVDALARLRTVRRLLAEDLGLEPSAELVALETSILNHDPVLRGVLDRGGDAGTRMGDAIIESRLPPARPLIGREGLLSSILDSLDDTRLLTIVGPGGVGKTSVAVTAAASLTHVSARFADLSAVSDPGGLLPTVLAAVGVRSDDLSQGPTVLVAALRSFRSPLLVVDNCEHLLDDAAALIVDLLDRCPGLRVVATSREPLRVPGERLVKCPPLSRADAISLFVARAQATDRDYAVGDDGADVVGSLVERLDGLPLAIELFAARVHSFSAQEMLHRLSDEELLTTSWRSTSSDRHRNLQEAVGWSYRMLDDDERTCLRRMAVFGGSFNAEDVRAVCQPASPDVLHQLVVRSLVVAERLTVGVRYRLLAPVRAFAAGLLALDADCADVRERLVARVCAWAGQVATSLEGADPATVVEELEHNAPNTRVAHERAAAQPGAAARLLAAFGPWAFSLTVALPEAVTWARAALDDPAAEERDRMVLLIQVARLSYVGTEERRAFLHSAIALAEGFDDPNALAAAWAELALVETDVAETSLKAAMSAQQLAEDAHQPVALGRAITFGATALIRLRRLDEAEQLLTRSALPGTRRFGIHESHVLYVYGRLAMLQGDLVAAGGHFHAAEHSAIRSGTLFGRSAAWFGLAEVDRLSGRVEEAFAGYRRCLPVDLVIEPGETGLVRMMIVWTACLVGEIEVAEHHAAVLIDELALEGDSESQTMIGATATAARGLLASAKGLESIADENLRRAITLWAVSDSWDVVADLIDRLSELRIHLNSGQALRALSASVRDGLTSAVDAAAVVEAL